MTVLKYFADAVAEWIRNPDLRKGSGADTLLLIKYLTVLYTHNTVPYHIHYHRQGPNKQSSLQIGIDKITGGYLSMVGY
jgi:hypothetical protein